MIPQRKFLIPDTVITKVHRLVEATCEAFREQRSVTVKDVQRVTGKLISLKLAVPSISVWLRELLFCLPHEDEEEDQPVFITEAAVDGLKVIQLLVDSNSGSPFMAPHRERCLRGQQRNWLGSKYSDVKTSNLKPEPSKVKTLNLPLAEKAKVFQVLIHVERSDSDTRSRGKEEEKRKYSRRRRAKKSSSSRRRRRRTRTRTRTRRRRRRREEKKKERRKKDTTGLYSTFSSLVLLPTRCPLASFSSSSLLVKT